MQNKKTLIAIMGPTASGKSDFALNLALKLKGEIVSADSAQIYKELSIITARIKPEEMQGIPHHLTGFISIDDKYSMAAYQRDAYAVIKDILDRGKTPILTGGTGLYLKAVLENYYLPESSPDEEYRRHLRLLSQSKGAGCLHQLLKEADPEAACNIHPNNIQRIIRALEIIKQTKMPLTAQQNRGGEHPLGIESRCYCLNYDRADLYKRINTRSEKMIEKGALKEVQELIKAGKKERLLELKILGCRELLAVLEGYCTFEEGIEVLKRNTRRYAKRQITWFKSHKNLQWLQMPQGWNEIENLCRILKPAGGNAQ